MLFPPKNDSLLVNILPSNRIFFQDLNANFYTTDAKNIMRFNRVFNPQNLEGKRAEKKEKNKLTWKPMVNL